jgi:transcriptional regulator with XRE-family HTH domain
MATFGNRLRLLREENGMKQKEVGGLLGVKESSVGKYENEQRTPSPGAINKLADYFQVSSDFLLGRSDIRFPADKIIAEHNDMIADLSEEARKEARNIMGYIREKYKPAKPE